MGALGLSQTASTGYAALGYSTSTSKLFAGYTSNTTDYQSAAIAAPTAAVWQHLAGVYASSTSRSGYLNGGNKLTVTNSIPSWVPTGYSILSVRANNTSPYNIWQGSVAFPAFWNVALSDNDILTLANGFSPRKIRPQNLISYCRLGGYSPEPDLKLPSGWTMPAGAAPFAANPRIFAP